MVTSLRAVKIVVFAVYFPREFVYTRNVIAGRNILFIMRADNDHQALRFHGVLPPGLESDVNAHLPSTRTQVDLHGCSELQKDADGDHLCNRDRARYQTGQVKNVIIPTYRCVRERVLVGRECLRVCYSLCVLASMCFLLYIRACVCLPSLCLRVCICLRVRHCSRVLACAFP